MVMIWGLLVLDVGVLLAYLLAQGVAAVVALGIGREIPMTVQKQIAMARSYLPANEGAYARSMSAAIRAAMSDKAASAYRAAIMVDGMVALFDGWATKCPTAKHVEG